MGNIGHCICIQSQPGRDSGMMGDAIFAAVSVTCRNNSYFHQSSREITGFRQHQGGFEYLFHAGQEIGIDQHLIGEVGEITAEPVKIILIVLGQVGQLSWIT